MPDQDVSTFNSADEASLLARLEPGRLSAATSCRVCARGVPLSVGAAGMEVVICGGDMGSSLASYTQLATVMCHMSSTNAFRALYIHRDWGG